MMVRLDESGAWDRRRLLREAADRWERARAASGVADQVSDITARATLAAFAQQLERDAAAFEAKAAILQAIIASDDRADGYRVEQYGR
jgi:hypothetical protein